MTDERARRNLLGALAVLFALTLLHDLDHARQGRELAAEVYVIGVVAFVSPFVVLGLILARHRLAPHAAALLGFGTVIGLVLVHVLPTWGPVSDSYGDAGVDGLAWASLAALIVGGLVLGLTAVRVIAGRDRRLSA